MASTDRSILLLDVMGTLVYDPFYEVMPRHFGMTIDELLEQKDPSAWIEFERGEIEEGEMVRRFFADRRPVDRGALRQLVRGSYRWLDGLEELLAELREAGVEMHLLSNYPTWFEIIEEKLGLSRYASWRFVSCKTGYRKPHPEAYLGAARSLGVSPQSCVFVDDREKNCSAAVAIGMRAIRFTDGQQLRRELAELDGILGLTARGATEER